MIIKNKNFSKKTFIVAEVGNNHEGCFKTAKKLIRKAFECGADAVKFQTFNIDRFVSSEEKKRTKILRKFKFSYEQFADLSHFSENLGIIFFSTPFDLESARFLNKIQPIFKIASGDNNSFELLDQIIEFNKPIIISTGMADLKLLKKIEFKIKKKIKTTKNKFISFLHCKSSYPVPVEEANLNEIKNLQNSFKDFIIGYSDHLEGNDACLSAVSMGAKIIEKHFTLNKNFSNFRDHKLSCDPRQMRELVKKIRLIEKLLGDDKIKISPCEKESLLSSRRSVGITRDLKKGNIITKNDLIMIRPGAGYKDKKNVIGKKLKKDVVSGSILKKSHLI